MIEFLGQEKRKEQGLTAPDKMGEPSSKTKLPGMPSIHQASPLRSSVTYKRHVEVCDFEDYLNSIKQGEIDKN